MNTVPIRWGAWDGDTVLNLSIPPQWQAHCLPMVDAVSIGGEKIGQALRTPFSTSPLKKLARGKRKIAIALEDITRPTKLEAVLQSVIQELQVVGTKRVHISFIVCNGAHAPMSLADMKKKFGESIVREFLVLNHHPYENLVETDVVLGKTPLKINRHFYEADLRIAIGSITPHSFAGFSSGAKLIIPGLSDIATLERSHKYVMMGFRGGVDNVEDNKFRQEIELAVDRIGLDFFIGLVPNSNREIAGVFSGDFIHAHRAGVNFARRVFRTNIQRPYDVIVLNAYPKDTELLQADTALTVLKTTKNEIVDNGGMVVVISRSSRGLGYHSLFGPGMALYRKPIKRRLLGDRKLIVFTPNANKAEFELVYWDGYHLANRWDSVVQLIQQQLPRQCKIAVLPCAPLQLLQWSI